MDVHELAARSEFLDCSEQNYTECLKHFMK